MSTLADDLFRLRYQVIRPSVTTMGACPKCGEPSRGSLVCADCLIDDMPEDMKPIARQWREFADKERAAWWQLEHMAEKAA